MVNLAEPSKDGYGSEGDILPPPPPAVVMMYICPSNKLVFLSFLHPSTHTYSYTGMQV
jgi:hypothetical protein